MASCKSGVHSGKVGPPAMAGWAVLSQILHAGYVGGQAQAGGGGGRGRQRDWDGEGEREGAAKREEERGRSREGESEADVYIRWAGSEVKAGQQEREARKREEAGPESASGKIRFKQRWPSDGRSDGRGNCGRRGHPERWPKQAGIMIVNMEKKFSLGVVTPSSKPRT